MTVLVSTTYADPDAVGLRWANFLAGLLHGSELGLVRAHVAPLAEVEEFCEAPRARLLRRQHACVDRRSGGRRDGRGGHAPRVRTPRRRKPAEPTVGGDRLGHEALGERGRHLRAGGRADGFPGRRRLVLQPEPRRGVRGGVPGAERSPKRQSRLLVGARRPELLAGGASSSLRSRTTFCVPGHRRRSDIVRGRLSGGARTWTHSLATPLDGDLELSLRMPVGAAHTLSLLDSRWSGSGARSLDRVGRANAPLPALRRTKCARPRWSRRDCGAVPASSKRPVERSDR